MLTVSVYRKQRCKNTTKSTKPSTKATVKIAILINNKEIKNAAIKRRISVADILVS